MVIVAGAAIPFAHGSIERSRAAAAARYVAVRLGDRALRGGQAFGVRGGAIHGRTQTGTDFRPTSMATATVCSAATSLETSIDRSAASSGSTITFQESAFAIAPDVTSLDPGSRLDPTDPIQIGPSTLFSFSPDGSSTSGTFYIVGRRASQFAVRVLGATGRARVFQFDFENGTMAADVDRAARHGANVRCRLERSGACAPSSRENGTRRRPVCRRRAHRNGLAAVSRSARRTAARRFGKQMHRRRPHSPMSCGRTRRPTHPLSRRPEIRKQAHSRRSSQIEQAFHVPTQRREDAKPSYKRIGVQEARLLSRLRAYGAREEENHQYQDPFERVKVRPGNSLLLVLAASRPTKSSARPLCLRVSASRHRKQSRSQRRYYRHSPDLLPTVRLFRLPTEFHLLAPPRLCVETLNTHRARELTTRRVFHDSGSDGDPFP